MNVTGGYGSDAMDSFQVVQRHLTEHVPRDRLAMARTNSPNQVLGSFRVFALRASDQRQVVVCIARVRVTPERLHEMFGGFVIFAAAVVRKTQGDVGWREARIAPECFHVSCARISLLALLLKG